MGLGAYILVTLTYSEVSNKPAGRLCVVFFAHKMLKKNPQKLPRKTQIHFFFLTASSAQTEEFMFQNVAY